MAWGEVMHEGPSEWWGAGSEPSTVLCCGRMMVCWLEEGGLRLGDQDLSYALLDRVLRRVSLWHGPHSNAAVRARATRVALMWSHELQLPLLMCPRDALLATSELHKPPPILFPRELSEVAPSLRLSLSHLLSLPQARDGGLWFSVQDGRRVAFAWLAQEAPPELEAQISQMEGLEKARLEHEGKESAVFRAHFRVLWGAMGDQPLRKVRSKRRYTARRPFEVLPSCVSMCFPFFLCSL